MSAPSNLTAIRDKVRKLTGSPSATQLTDPQIDDYINTFLLYDLPENLRLFNLHQPYIFYTQPNIDSYAFPRNDYLTINPPLYIAGYYSFWSQSQEQFYRIYPQLNDLQDVSTGSGIAGPYIFTIPNVPVLQGYVQPGSTTVYSNVVISAGTLFLRDDAAGGWLDENNIPRAGTINYVTGACTINFSGVANPGVTISAQSVPYQAARPQGLLFYDDTITLRPVPDQIYKVEMQSYIKPTALLAGNQEPLLNEWWQYIAFGAAKKIFEDRLDADGWSKIQPFYNEQERIILRRTIVQQTNNSTSTIYTEMTSFPATNYYNGM